MNRKQETAIFKRTGTKKHCKEALQKHRSRSFLNQKLGTVTHKTDKDYDCQKEKTSLRKDESLWYLDPRG